MSLPEPLRFTVGLVDQISKPLGNIRRQMNQFTEGYRDASYTMASGAAGMVASGYALKQAMMPAIEMDRALGEVKSLGVADESLKAITQTAFKFSAEFGKSSLDVVRHAEGMRLAIGKLPADVMASVTNSSATLAMAMKSDAETTSRFMKNLYGNYKDQADAMGVDTWTAQIAGMTATAKQLYGVEMGAIEGMVDGMHSLTSTMGVSLQEQFAVFGMLKEQMSEGDAVTQYTNFLENAVSAQDKLGVSLTDTNGQLLPMKDVLENIAPLLEGLSGTEARTLLDNAGLGDGALMLTNLVARMDEFKTSINTLSNVQGLDAATKMAKDMTDQWERMEQGIFAIRTAFGAALLPSLVPVLSSLADGAGEIIKWTELFPNLTKYIGYATLAFFGLAAAGGAITLMMGIGRQAMLTWSLATKIAKAVASGFSSTLKFMRGAMLALAMANAQYGIAAKLSALGQGALTATMVAAKAAYAGTAGVMGFLTTGMYAATAAALKFAAAVALNPITLVVVGIVAAIAAVGTLIYYWEDLKASFGDTAWFKVLTIATAPIRMLFAAIHGGWKWVTSGFTDLTAFDGLFNIVDEVKAAFGDLFGWMGDGLDNALESAKDLVSWIPGLGDDDEQPGKKVQAVASATPRNQVQRGGAARAMASYQTNATHYGGVSIYAQQMNNPQDLATELEMNTP